MDFRARIGVETQIPSTGKLNKLANHPQFLSQIIVPACDPELYQTKICIDMYRYVTMFHLFSRNIFRVDWMGITMESPSVAPGCHSRRSRPGAAHWKHCPAQPRARRSALDHQRTGRLDVLWWKRKPRGLEVWRNRLNYKIRKTQEIQEMNSKMKHSQNLVHVGCTRTCNMSADKVNQSQEVSIIHIHRQLEKGWMLTHTAPWIYYI